MPRVIALDANLLVLFVVGLTNPNYISTHRRLRAYSKDDFDLLKAAVAASAELVVTPNSLTEASNLLRQIGEPAKSSIATTFQSLINNAREIYVPSTNAAVRSEFTALGLADSALLEVSKRDIAILSADLDLCIAASQSGYRAVNFNHLREDSGLM